MWPFFLVGSLGSEHLASTEWMGTCRPEPTCPCKPCLNRTMNQCSLELQWKWKSLSHVWLFATPWNYTIHGILQARILEWVAVSFSRASSQSRDQTQVSCIADGFVTSWATREAQYEVINSTLKKKNKKKLRTLPKTEPHELTYGVDFPKWDCPASRMIFACWVSCFSLSCQYE